MVGKFFVITLNYKGGQKSEAIQGALAAFEWMRFASNSYYVYSNHQRASELYEIVRPVLDPTDDILVVEVSIANRKGWASKVAVDWLNRARA